MRRRWIPPLRFYRSIIVQGVAIFVALIGYGHQDHRIAWTIGGYLFGLAGMTLAWFQDEWERSLRRQRSVATPNEDAAVERVKTALLLEYPWHKYDSWGGEGPPGDGQTHWPHLQHVAEVAAHAALTDQTDAPGS